MLLESLLSERGGYFRGRPTFRFSTAEIAVAAADVVVVDDNDNFLATLVVVDAVVVAAAIDAVVVVVSSVAAPLRGLPALRFGGGS